MASAATAHGPQRRGSSRDCAAAAIAVLALALTAVTMKPFSVDGDALPDTVALMAVPDPEQVEHPAAEALTEGGADAALAASLFHYKELEIREVKEYLAARGIPVRLPRKGE